MSEVSGEFQFCQLCWWMASSLWISESRKLFWTITVFKCSWVSFLRESLKWIHIFLNFCKFLLLLKNGTDWCFTLLYESQEKPDIALFSEIFYESHVSVYNLVSIIELVFGGIVLYTKSLQAHLLLFCLVWLPNISTSVLLKWMVFVIQIRKSWTVPWFPDITIQPRLLLENKTQNRGIGLISKWHNFFLVSLGMIIINVLQQTVLTLGAFTFVATLWDILTLGK